MKPVFTLISACAALILTAIISINGLPIVLLFPLAILLMSALYSVISPAQLTITRTISPPRAYHAQLIEVTLLIENGGGHLTELHIKDEMSLPFELAEGAGVTVLTLPGGQSAEINYTIKAKRGLYRADSIRVQWVDFFGLFYQHKRLVVAGDVELEVSPKQNKLPDVVIRPKQTRSFAGVIPARLAGSGLDFFGVRDYRSGDSLRHINWRAMAKHPDAIFTNEFEQERIADIGLILDAREITIRIENRDELLEHQIRALIGFADSFLSAGHRVSLLIYGNVLNWTLPGYGKRHLSRLRNELAKVKLGSSEVFTTLDNLPTRMFPSKSQIILFSPLAKGDDVMLTRLRGQGYSVICISPDPVAYEAEFLPQTTRSMLAQRLARIERTLLLRDISKSGVQVVDWDVNQPLDQLVRVKLHRAPRMWGSI